MYSIQSLFADMSSYRWKSARHPFKVLFTLYLFSSVVWEVKERAKKGKATMHLQRLAADHEPNPTKSEQSCESIAWQNSSIFAFLIP